uniref:Zinc finger MYM-type protein 5 n=2 Tax=Schizaphis graminum TaxID=13262 RepID=A0A2S2PLW4_SCHGA
MNSEKVCMCGKRREGLNKTNWTRHINSCKTRKLSLNNSISRFFGVVDNTTQVSNSWQSNIHPIKNKLEENTIQCNASSSQINTPIIHIETELEGLKDSTVTLPLDNDPAKLCKIKSFTYEMVDKIIEMGLCQPTAKLLPNKEFPSNKFGRKFHPSWYLRKFGDGSVANRIWLSYSISNDKIYCLDCLLFAGKGVVQQAPKAAWTSIGFNTWSTGHFSIMSHELDSFSSFSQIYGYFIDEKMLRSEYIQFAENLPHFLKNMALPTFLHASESDSENSTISSEEEERYNHGSTQNESMNHASLGNIFNIFWKNKLQDVFPNLYIMVKIALTLPVGSATTERSFSKLKIIKNRLRSTMAGERLENLMKISCENNIDIDYDKILNIFSSKNPGLLKLLTI